MARRTRYWPQGLPHDILDRRLNRQMRFLPDDDPIAYAHDLSDAVTDHGVLTYVCVWGH